MNPNETAARTRPSLAALAEDAPTATDIKRRLDTTTSSTLGARNASHRRLFAGSVSVLATAATIAVVAVAANSSGLGRHDRDSSAAALDPARSSTGPAIANPVSIGRGRAVLDVPGAWGRNDIRCGVATADTVAFEAPGQRACASTPSRSDSLLIGSAATHPTTDRGSAGRRIPGGSASEVAFRSESQSDGYTVIQIWVPSQDAWFRIRTDSASLGQAIADSLRLLPDSQVVVPDIFNGATSGRPGVLAAPSPDEVSQRLQQAGLAVSIRYAPGASSTNWAGLTSDVQPGTIVSSGSTITVTYTANNKTP